jgi:hypothetical protein
MRKVYAYTTDIKPGDIILINERKQGHGGMWYETPKEYDIDKLFSVCRVNNATIDICPANPYDDKYYGFFGAYGNERIHKGGFNHWWYKLTSEEVAQVRQNNCELHRGYTQTDHFKNAPKIEVKSLDEELQKYTVK